MGRLATSSGTDSGTTLGRAPAVSVIVPTYERREYVRRAVRSIFTQRFQDWELIVVDDGSTDGTGEAFRAFEPRLRYLWQENAGVAAARNAGLRLARGDVVAFLDSDDHWLPDHLETVVAMLERHPRAVLACTTPRSHVGGRERLHQARLVDALPVLLLDNFFGTSGVAVRRQPLLAVGGFDEEMVVLEDGELWLRLATCGPFCFLQRRTMVRQHTRGSLGDWGSRNGEYLRAIEHMAEIAVGQVARISRSDATTLAARAEGKLRYCEALLGLAAGDTEAVRTGLREACRRLPELSSDPWFIHHRVKSIGGERRERLRNFGTAADHWPDPRCDTALSLRLQAILVALRLRQLRQAAAQLRAFPLSSAPGFLLRTRQLTALLLTRKLQSFVYRGSDTKAVEA